ncbi:reverse transcriptase domain-containing protein [Tanacetum coccineum]
MRTRSSSNIVDESSPNPTTSNPRRRNRRRSKQPFSLEESPVDTMADQRTMAELLRAPTEGYAEAIVVPPILAEHFELKHSLINMMTSDQFFRLEKDNPHDHIRWFNKITSTIKYKDVPNSAIKLMLFPFSLVGAACCWLEKEPPRSILTWEDLVSKFINEFFPPSRTTNLRNEIFNFEQRFGESFHEAWDRYKDLLRGCSHHGFTELHQLDTFYNALNTTDQDSLNSAAGSNLLERTTPPPASVKAVEKIYVTCGGAHPYYQCLAADGDTFQEYWDNIQGYVAAAAVNYNQGDPAKFLIPCDFSKLKCKALADLGAIINLIPLSVLKKLGLPELISTRMTLELANRTICILAGIARDVFVPVGKFTFPAYFIIVDYESDTRVPLILGRPFLRTFRTLIDVHGEEMILHEGDERLIINMRNDTSRYSNTPQKESINMIDIYNISHEEYLEDLLANEKITNHPSDNPTSSLTSNTDLTSPEVNDDISDPEGDIIENLLNLNKTKDLPPYHDNPLSGSTTSSSPSLSISETSDYFLEEFADELVHFAFPPGTDYLPFDIKSDLREIEYLLNHDPSKEMDYILEYSVDKNSPDDNLVETISEMFTDEHALDYSSPPLWDDYDDELFDLETVNDNTYDDPFDSKEEKINDSKILIDELDPPGSSNFLPFPECDSVFYEDFLEVDALPSTNNEDKVFNPGILIHENHFEVTNYVTPEINVKKTTNASLILEDFNPPLYGLPFHKEVPGFETPPSFSSENEEKVFNPRILTSKGVHTSLISELSHWGPKAFKVVKIFESSMEIFPCSYREDIRVLDVPCLHFYTP